RRDEDRVVVQHEVAAATEGADGGNHFIMQRMKREVDLAGSGLEITELIETRDPDPLRGVDRQPIGEGERRAVMNPANPVELQDALYVGEVDEVVRSLHDRVDLRVPEVVRR